MSLAKFETVLKMQQLEKYPHHNLAFLLHSLEFTA